MPMLIKPLCIILAMVPLVNASPMTNSKTKDTNQKVWFIGGRDGIVYHPGILG